MKKETKTTFTSIILTALLFVATITQNAYPETTGQRTITSTPEQQTAVSVTAYNSNLALIREQREIALDNGQSQLQFTGVASQLIPPTVQIKATANPEAFTVIEQNYEYDILNPQKLTDKYVGKDVQLYTKNPYTERDEIVTATVLANNGTPIYKIGDQITFGHPGRIIFPAIPENLISKPTLVWLVENTGMPKQKLEVTYLASGMNWQADYILTLNDSDNRADLSSWVTIDNKTGATYKEATLKLVAGEINRATTQQPHMDRAMKMAQAEAAAPQFKEEEFFEYHLYSLQRPTTLKDMQTKQINLATTEDIPINKEFTCSGMPHYYQARYPDTITNQKVAVYIEFDNKKENRLGMPLPKGVVRVYKRDKEGALQFSGEDTINHTPKDEKVRIKMGNAFDIAATRKQMDWRKVAYDTYESTYEISLRNHKKDHVKIKVIEPIPGDWTITKTTSNYTKTSASTAEFIITVPKDKESKLTYTVRTRY